MKETIHNDITYIIGENAKDNWDILDNAKQNDIWFHLDKFTSSYIIMKSTDTSKINIIYGAILCKENSKYKNFKNLKITYCSVKQLKKTKVIGEVKIKGKNNNIFKRI